MIDDSVKKSTLRQMERSKIEEVSREVGGLKFKVEVEFAVAGCSSGSTFFLFAC